MQRQIFCDIIILIYYAKDKVIDERVAKRKTCDVL